MIRWILAVAALAAATSPARAQDPALLTLERIFASGEFSPGGVPARWSDDGSAYLKTEAAAKGGRGRDIVSVDAETGATTILVEAAKLVPPGRSEPLNIEGFEFSKDRSKVLIFTESRRVWRVNSRGDFWVFDRTSNQATKLGGDFPASSLSHAKFSPDGERVAYVHKNGLYVEDLREPGPKPLARSDDPDVVQGTFDWVYEEELSLRDGYRWSPDGRRIAYWRLDTTGVPEFPLVNNTDGLYPTVTRYKYPKVGQTNAAATIEVVDVATREVAYPSLPGDPRENYVAYLEWAPKGSELIVQQLNRRQNEATVRRLRLAPAKAASTAATTAPAAQANEVEVETIHVERDAAWLDLQDEVPLTPHGRLVWLSEKSGWRHLYTINVENGESKPVTSGDYDVISLLSVDPKGEWAYFLASPDESTRSYLYWAKLDGSTPAGERLTPKNQPGSHVYRIAPDARHAFHTYSTFDAPPATELVRLPSHEVVKTLSDAQAAKKRLAALKPTRTEFLKVPIEGATLDAWRILPPDFDATKKYPLIVHVYGEPAGRTVTDAWAGANGLWHRMMAQRGYVVMSFDNRGTPAPLGRAWRKAVHHKIGVIAPREQAAALERVLKDSPWLDPKRVGVWGWSGGGSMTLNAMFKFPDLYSVGVSIAPVPNQRYYDTIYQERYMGLPGDDVDGFREGSPINFAAGLKGKLLIVHGTGDDNCHYQTTEMLVNELIRLGKAFDMMAYPNRSHAINEGANTTMHLRTLMTRYFETNLPAGPR